MKIINLTRSSKTSAQKPGDPNLWYPRYVETKDIDLPPPPFFVFVKHLTHSQYLPVNLPVYFKVSLATVFLGPERETIRAKYSTQEHIVNGPIKAIRWSLPFQLEIHCINSYTNKSPWKSLIETFLKLIVFFCILTFLYSHQLPSSSSACHQLHISKTHGHLPDVQILNVWQWLQE